MKSTCIERAAARKDFATLACVRAARRGTAEIELLLVIPVLLLIFILSGGALILGKYRLQNVYNAEQNAYTQIETGYRLSPANDPVPVEGIAAFQTKGGGLPNRFADADLTRTANLNPNQNNALVSVRLHDRALFLDPSWHLDATPIPADRAPLLGWFSAYVEESHPSDLVYSLGLQPAGPQE